MYVPLDGYFMACQYVLHNYPNDVAKFSQFPINPDDFLSRGLWFTKSELNLMITANEDIHKHAKKVENVSFEE